MTEYLPSQMDTTVKRDFGLDSAHTQPLLRIQIHLIENESPTLSFRHCFGGDPTSTKPKLLPPPLDCVCTVAIEIEINQIFQ